MPMSVPSVSGGVAPARYDQPYMPNYAWPSYAAYPNYAAVTYPRQYSPTAWPYIGPFLSVSSGAAWLAQGDAGMGRRLVDAELQAVEHFDSTLPVVAFEALVLTTHQGLFC